MSGQRKYTPCTAKWGLASTSCGVDDLETDSSDEEAVPDAKAACFFSASSSRRTWDWIAARDLLKTEFGLKFTVSQFKALVSMEINRTFGMLLGRAFYQYLIWPWQQQQPA